VIETGVNGVWCEGTVANITLLVEPGLVTISERLSLTLTPSPHTTTLSTSLEVEQGLPPMLSHSNKLLFTALFLSSHHLTHTPQTSQIFQIILYWDPKECKFVKLNCSFYFLTRSCESLRELQNQNDYLWWPLVIFNFSWF